MDATFSWVKGHKNQKKKIALKITEDGDEPQSLRDYIMLLEHHFRMKMKEEKCE